MMIGHHFADRIIDRAPMEKPFAHKPCMHVLNVRNKNGRWEFNWNVMKSNFHFFALLSLSSLSPYLSISVHLTNWPNVKKPITAHWLISHTSATSHLLTVSVIYKLILLSANNIHNVCFDWFICLKNTHNTLLVWLCFVCESVVTRIGSAFFARFPRSELVSIFT